MRSRVRYCHFFTLALSVALGGCDSHRSVSIADDATEANDAAEANDAEAALYQARLVEVTLAFCNCHHGFGEGVDGTVLISFEGMTAAETAPGIASMTLSPTDRVASLHATFEENTIGAPSMFGPIEKYLQVGQIVWRYGFYLDPWQLVWSELPRGDYIQPGSYSIALELTTGELVQSSTPFHMPFNETPFE